MDNLIGIKYIVLEKVYEGSVFFYEIESAEKKGVLTTIKSKAGHTVVRYCDEYADVAYDVDLERYLSNDEIRETL